MAVENNGEALSLPVIDVSSSDSQTAKDILDAASLFDVSMSTAVVLRGSVRGVGVCTIPFRRMAKRKSRRNYRRAWTGCQQHDGVWIDLVVWS